MFVWQLDISVIFSEIRLILLVIGNYSKCSKILYTFLFLFLNKKVIPENQCEIQNMEFNSFLASGNFLSSADDFANNLDPDQDQQNISPDLDPSSLTLR